MDQPPIIFQNDHFAVLDKPCGWLSVPSRMGADDERPVAGLWLQTKLGRRVWVVHRLDLEVSGLIAFALSADAQRVSNNWFEKRLVHKKYSAYSLPAAAMPRIGEPQTWTSKLVRGKKRAFEAEHGKEAITIAVCLGEVELAGRKLLKWDLLPQTGRSHQLRYEMARHGFAIVGDKLYGSDAAWTSPGAIGLRAVELDFADCPEARAFGLPNEFRIK